LKGILILLAVILVAVFFCGVLPAIQTNLLNIPVAARPFITLPEEALTHHPLIDLPGEFNDIYLTNVMIGTLLADLVVILLAVLFRVGLKEVPSGISNAVEALFEVLHNMSEQVVGHKWVNRIFPIAASIFVFLIFVNWIELVPGADSIGLLEHVEEDHAGHPVIPAGRIFGRDVYLLDVNPQFAGGVTPEEAVDTGVDPEERYQVVAFVRTPSTAINLPLGLALISFITIQVFGALGLGIHYLAKFINTPALERGGMGIMDFGVSFLELILEPVKMISLTFRLLGNIFGGTVLLFVISTLIPFLVPVAIYGFEFFVGVIQAYVFMMLTLVFSTMAMSGHGPEEAHEHA